MELSPLEADENEESEKHSERDTIKDYPEAYHPEETGVSGQEVSRGSMDSRGKTDSLGKAASGDETQAGVTAECVVHICGAVNRPGVYALPAGSRICDAVSRAGGLCEDAAERCVNQASLLEDGMQIVIPTLEEAETMQQAGEKPQDAAGLRQDAAAGVVNINSASLSELMTLPGIGQAKAETILAWREKNGAFGKIEDIMKVDGIGEGSFQKLKDLITV